jgi:hypothetical protein
MPRMIPCTSCDSDSSREFAAPNRSKAHGEDRDLVACKKRIPFAQILGHDSDILMQLLYNREHNRIQLEQILLYRHVMRLSAFIIQYRDG